MNEFNGYGYGGQNSYINGYRSYMTQPGFQGNQGQPSMPSPPQQTSNIPWIQVPSIEAARNVMVQPNQTAYMMNQNAPEFYVKSADPMGVASIKFYRFEEYNPEIEMATKLSQAQSDNFVTVDRFNQFVSTVSAELEKIKKDSSQLPVKTEEKKETKGGKS